MGRLLADSAVRGRVGSPTANPPAPTRPGRMPSRTGSFRAGSPLPTLRSTTNKNFLRRLSTQHHYHTFPTAPPKSAGVSPGSSGDFGSPDDEPHHGSRPHQHQASTPLPYKQLALLAVLSLAEQTALNSIGPYLPKMVASFPGIAEDRVGLYVGLLASSFALAQLATNLLWGYLSDIIGRKPVMLFGTSSLCICFTIFGFCTEYWHIIVVHIAMGLLNGNAAVVPTCLGELTDRSNQSKAFTWLPVVYSLGSITGPAVGGLLVDKTSNPKYPFLAPNLLGAALLGLSVLVLIAWFDETLESEHSKVDLLERFQYLFCCCRRRTKKGLKNLGISGRSSSSDDDDDDGDDQQEGEGGEAQRLLGPHVSEREYDADTEDAKGGLTDRATWRQIMNRTTIILLGTSLIFQLTNSSFNSLYPIFASEKEPTGRGLGADVIGVTLSIAGACTILFQLFLFRTLKSRLGNVGCYRGSLLGFTITMALMPFVGYRDGSPPFGKGDSKMWLYVEIGIILVIKNICAVGGLSSVMLLITNSAPTHATLGTLNGVAQTLSAAGRSVGPFLSGALFTASTHVRPKGEALAWGLFAGIGLAGWLGSYAVRGRGLESHDDGYESDGGDDDHHHHHHNTHRRQEEGEGNGEGDEGDEQEEGDEREEAYESQEDDDGSRHSRRSRSSV